MTISNEIKKKIPMPSLEIQKKELTVINTLTGKDEIQIYIKSRVSRDICFKKRVKQKC